MTEIIQSKGMGLLSKSLFRQSLACALLKPLRIQFAHHRDPTSYPHLPVRDDARPMDRKDNTKVYDACWQTMRRSEFKCRSDVEFNMPSFISERKACLSDPCANDVTAWDLTHYKPQDMLKRKYPRTWDECVLKCRKRKMKCVPKRVNPKRRKRCPVKSPCPVDCCVLGKLDLTDLTEPCELMKPTLCPRFKMPNCCEGARDPPICRRPYLGGRCKRRKTKYPSFSECCHEPIPDKAPVECNCLMRPSMCEVWRHYRKRH